MQATALIRTMNSDHMLWGLIVTLGTLIDIWKSRISAQSKSGAHGQTLLK